MTTSIHDRRASGQGLTAWLAGRVAHARIADLAPAVEKAAVDRIVDSVAACVSGAALPAGEAARRWVLDLGGTPQATLIGTDRAVPAVHAALGNAMMAHADETDDVDLRTKAHPGSSVVPAALAMAERAGTGGGDLLRAVVVGYDVAVRLLAALDPEALARAGRSLQGIGSTFGATAAAVLLTQTNERQVRHAFSYAAQQASGIATWPRDPDHVEKAFDLAGMGARNGVTAATMVDAGQTGVEDVFDGDPAGLGFLAPDADAARAAETPDEWRVATAIKPYPVGYPIQAALDALLALVAEEPLAPSDVAGITVRLPGDGARIVDGRAIPSINVQHVLAVALIDGGVTFRSMHDVTRLDDPAVRSLVARTRLVGDPAMWDPVATRQAAVEITTVSGETRSRHVRFARGTPQNPMSSLEVDAKALALMEPVIGSSAAATLVARLRDLHGVADVRELRPLLGLPTSA